ncbi:MAG: membrane protein [Planctomycetota bacterium]|nr:MAG: membrane protein [Planctomycetota bacterium]
MLLLGAAGIACAPLLVRVSELEPTATAFWRVALASPVLAALAWRARHGAEERATAPTQQAHRVATWKLLLPGVFFAGDLGLWHQALRDTTVAHATLLANGAPLVVALGGWLLLGERLSRRFLVALGVALLGAVLLANHAEDQARAPLRGDLFGVGTAFFYGAYLLSVRQLRAAGVGAARLMTIASISSAVLLLSWCLLAGEDLRPQSLEGWGWLLALALVSHVGGQGLIAWALAHLPASYSSLALLAQPVMVGAAGWWLFGERLSGLQLAGAGLVLGAVLSARQHVAVSASALRSAGAPRD